MYIFFKSWNPKFTERWKTLVVSFEISGSSTKIKSIVVYIFAYTRFYATDRAKHVPAGWQPLTCGLAPVWLHCTATSSASLLYRLMSGRWWAAAARGWCVCGRPGWGPSYGRCTTGGLNSQGGSWTEKWNELSATGWFLKASSNIALHKCLFPGVIKCFASHIIHPLPGDTAKVQLASDCPIARPFFARDHFSVYSAKSALINESPSVGTTYVRCIARLA